MLDEVWTQGKAWGAVWGKGQSRRDVVDQEGFQKPAQVPGNTGGRHSVYCQPKELLEDSPTQIYKGARRVLRFLYATLSRNKNTGLVG